MVAWLYNKSHTPAHGVDSKQMRPIAYLCVLRCRAIYSSTYYPPVNYAALKLSMHIRAGLSYTVEQNPQR